VSVDLDARSTGVDVDVLACPLKPLWSCKVCLTTTSLSISFPLHRIKPDGDLGQRKCAQSQVTFSSLENVTRPAIDRPPYSRITPPCALLCRNMPWSWSGRSKTRPAGKFWSLSSASLEKEKKRPRPRHIIPGGEVGGGAPLRDPTGAVITELRGLRKTLGPVPTPGPLEGVASKLPSSRPVSEVGCSQSSSSLTRGFNRSSSKLISGGGTILHWGRRPVLGRAH
jgi:hypothetical protein